MSRFLDFYDLRLALPGLRRDRAFTLAAIAMLALAIGLNVTVFTVMAAMLFRAYPLVKRNDRLGVRMAIGAAAKDIRRMVLREGMLPVATGMILGLATSLAVNRILQSQLVGVSPYDPATMGGAPVVLIVVALLACEIPARRAMHVDPAVALRHE